MQIYNTLTKKKEDFKPTDPPNVKFYMCGPTVYDYFHIGNGKSFIMADMIRRYLEYKGYNVKFVMNITDIDDKIIKKSNEENITTSEIAAKYEKAFFDDLNKLKIKTNTLYPKATDHINEIISLIKKLEEKEFAYNINGNVFYSVSKFNGYGKLSGKNIEDLEAGSRVEINEEKKNPLDFTLWKKAKEGEPYWESPWGQGRPGWHIECSAMSNKHLGDNIDIHAGGSDLIFPHHENEIAQSEAVCESKFVNYWIHFGFLNIKDEKMSKSLGNFFTAQEILRRHSAEAIHLFFAQSHYAGPLNYSEELLETAEKGLEKLKNLIETLGEKLSQELTASDDTTDFNFKHYYDEFEKEMDDDFNTPKAAAVIFDFVKNVNKKITENNLPVSFYKNAKEFLQKTAEGVLGIVSFESGEKKIDESREKELIELLIKLRSDAKIEKNYALADKIRDELEKIGIILQDEKEGTKFKLSNKK